jgi:hypothetical protein
MLASREIVASESMARRALRRTNEQLLLYRDTEPAVRKILVSFR